MYNIKSLNPRHFRILDMRLRGIPNIAIAAKLDMSPTAISVIVNSNSFKHELALEQAKVTAVRNENVALENSILRSPDTVTIKEKARTKLEEATLQAVEALVLNVQSDDESISNRASAEILDRAGGFQKIVRNENISQSLIVNISDTVANRLADALTKDKPLGPQVVSPTEVKVETPMEDN